MTYEKRLIRREDTVSRNRRYAKLETSVDVTTLDVYTPILAVEITPKHQDSVVIFTSLSLTPSRFDAYALIRLTITQAGLTKALPESEGKALPFGEEYHRQIVVTGLSLGDAVGISLEVMPSIAAARADRADLYKEEW